MYSIYDQNQKKGVLYFKEEKLSCFYYWNLKKNLGSGYTFREKMVTNLHA